jgi:hypothetical protein
MAHLDLKNWFFSTPARSLWIELSPGYAEPVEEQTALKTCYIVNEITDHSPTPCSETAYSREGARFLIVKDENRILQMVYDCSIKVLMHPPARESASRREAPRDYPMITAEKTPVTQVFLVKSCKQPTSTLKLFITT